MEVPMLDNKSRKALNSLFVEHNFTDYKWIKTEEIVTSQWVRMKCMFGCDSCGSASCFPNVPAVDECERFFNEYDEAAIFHIEETIQKSHYSHEWVNKVIQRLFDVERTVFLAGYYRAYGMFMAKCRFCDPCMRVRSKCLHPLKSRPTPEGLGVDVFATARNVGYTIDVLNKPEGCMNRYALLLVE